MNNTRTREEWYADYMDYRLTYLKRKKPANDFVRCFLNWCGRQYGANQDLTQEMIDEWCARRLSEKERSHVSRVSAINTFLKFLNAREEGPYDVIVYDKITEKTPEPVLFSRKELKNFFRAVDEIDSHDNSLHPYPRFQAKLKALVAPALFRMLYSTGMRPNEVRWLDCEDVNLEKGVVYLRRTKGYNERVIAMHPGLTAMLRQYDALMEKEMPGRKVFFPNDHDEYRDAYFITTKFKQCWYKYNPHGDREVVPYSLRHNYAVENIMSWENDDEGVDEKMLSLSKSMGHERISSTMYYFHLVPRFANLLEGMEGEQLDEMLKSIKD